MTLFSAALFSMTSCKSRPSAGKDEVIVNGVVVPKLLPRKANLGPESEQKQIQLVYDEAIQAIGKDTTKAEPFLKLATAYIAEGRVSGNGGYYSNAAIRMLDRALEAEEVTVDDRFQVYSLKSAALLNLHRFDEALTVARQGLAINDYNSGIYGALVDANVELGHYAEAVQACDRMLQIRPDLRSYSRASYLRQIHGDIPGAIAAMKMAVEAGIPGDESTEWTRVTLGDLYLAQGSADTARMLFEQSLSIRPSYPQAEMGLARADAATGQYDNAIGHARNAVKLLPESAFVSYLADLYAMKGDVAKAKEIRSDVLDKLVEGEREAQKDAVKHNGTRELAQAYLAAGKLDDALKYARQDWNMRPDNIDANELMGWVLYKKGDLANARRCAEKALATGIKNPATLYKAGTILSHSGNVPRGDSLQAFVAGKHPRLAQVAANGAL